MAVVSPEPAINGVQVPYGTVYTMIAGNDGEIVENLVFEDKIYVAVGKDVKESKLTLLWVLKNFSDKKICLLHVHQPAQMIPLMGGKFPASKMKEQEVRAYHELERQSLYKVLKEYLHICDKNGIRAEEVHTEADCIEKEIVEKISHLGIKKLVMGAAADKHYSKKKMDIKSRKAIYVRSQAPGTCHIWFVCKGHLIYKRDANLDRADLDMRPTLPEASLVTEIAQSSPLRSQSLMPRPEQRLSSPFQDLICRVRSISFDMHDGGGSEISSPGSIEQVSTPCSRLDAEGSSDEWNGTSRNSPTQGCHLSKCSSNEVLGMALVPISRFEENENELMLSALPQPNDEHHCSSPPRVLQGGTVNDELYDRLEQALAEAENSRQEAFKESLRRRKAEKNAIEAIRRAGAAESLYNEELKQRKIIEETLLKEKQELEKMKNQQDVVQEELQDALNQKLSLESQIADSDKMVEELDGKIISAVELLQNFKKERDELEIERDKALVVAEEMRKEQAGTLSTNMLWFSEFSLLEIEEATRYFHPSLKIGEGGYGSIYKGFLHHTEVAIKMLNPQSLQGPSEYQQEVDVLSKLRHPNLVTLIGACPEAWTLVYEYLPNGSLEDRLICKENSPPLTWQMRIRIAAELCSALIFLHSSKPYSVIHGDLKPSNILLDANFVSKLSDFGICRKLCEDENSSHGLTLCHRTGPKGTFAYMDPEFLATGELTPKSDVYSFGIILLRLLTGRPALGITKDVKSALDNGNLKSLLDYSAGDWPYIQAHQLAHSALRCAEMSRRDRPDLQSDVWRVLEPMRASCGGSLSTFRLGSEELCQAPHYFICPIFQEVMQDPHVAADGFTYEAEALKGWLDSGHDTSPMTNVKLVHTNLVPNHALRSAIQEWLQQH